MVETLVHVVGPTLATAVLGVVPPGPDDDVLELLVAVCGMVGPGGIDRVRLAFSCVVAVESAVGDGAASLWLRLPDPALFWDPPGAVISEAEPTVCADALAASAVTFIEMATDCGGPA
ncbi:MAG: hypothetical protein LC789_11645 [Actinobacteria bacterium]|nr:hypothetical protein [Actinomycetota bacterium]